MLDYNDVLFLTTKDTILIGRITKLDEGRGKYHFEMDLDSRYHSYLKEGYKLKLQDAWVRYVLD